MYVGIGASPSLLNNSELCYDLVHTNHFYLFGFKKKKEKQTKPFPTI